jgi:UDP-2,3-diacylglucosamine pyrophosphatase LpxH
MHFKTIVVSDIHLGTKDSKSKEFAIFLKNNSCDKLILNGDIIDAWNLRRNGKWTKRDSRVFRRILKMMEDHATEVIYVRGNHDDFLKTAIPFSMGNFKILDSYILKSNGIEYFITHGDIFDVVSSKFRWLAHIGDVGYKLLLFLNRRYNKYRRLKGLPYFSVSQNIKHKVKVAVSYIGDFEKVMTDFARKKNYKGIICGHIHSPANKMIDGIHYLNSGDWVETMSALVEDFDGNWNIVYFQSKELDYN